MRKRLLSGVVTCAVVTTLCAGCGGSSSDIDKSKLTTIEEKVDKSQTVSLKVWGSEADTEFTQSLIDSFVAAHKGEATFDIVFEAHEEMDATKDGLGNVEECADVFSMPDDQLSAFAAAGVCKPIKYADKIKSNNIEASVTAATINDQVYAYPMTADNGYFLYYNKKYLSSSDVETMDKLLNAAAKQNKKFCMDWDSGWYLYSFFANTGLELGLNDDGMTNYCTWNSGEGDIKGTDVGEAMWNIAGKSSFNMTNDDGFVAEAKAGNAVAGVSGVWLASSLKEIWGDDLTATKLPTYTCAGKQVQMGSYSGYKMVGVNSHSKFSDWAEELAAWFTNEESQKLRFEKRGNTPSNKTLASSDEITSNVENKGLIEQSPFASLQRVGGMYWTPSRTFGTYMGHHDMHGNSMQKLLDAMVEQIVAIN